MQFKLLSLCYLIYFLIIFGFTVSFVLSLYICRVFQIAVEGGGIGHFGRGDFFTG